MFEAMGKVGGERKWRMRKKRCQGGRVIRTVGEDTGRERGLLTDELLMKMALVAWGEITASVWLRQACV